MEKIIDETKELLKNVNESNKAHALHYLWGAIQSSVREGKTSISYENLVKLLQEAIRETDEI